MNMNLGVHLRSDTPVATGGFSRAGCLDTLRIGDQLSGPALSLYLGHSVREVYINATKLRVALAEVINSIEDIEGEPPVVEPFHDTIVEIEQQTQLLQRHP